jgi:hypothetical protein
MVTKVTHFFSHSCVNLMLKNSGIGIGRDRQEEMGGAKGESKGRREECEKKGKKHRR